MTLRPDPIAMGTEGESLPLLREACLIDGAWVGADDGATVAVADPATGRPLGHVPWMGRAEAERAIGAAGRAFRAWRLTTAQERSRLLRAWAGAVRAEAEALARLLTAEQGKPLREARVEIAHAAAYLEWFAEEARRTHGETIPSPDADRRLFTVRQPVGVVAAITPWNFPAAMVARKLGPALAAGCTVVLKPAAQTPYSALALVALAEQAGLPAGVLNVVMGDAAAIGACLTDSPIVRKLTFTGSTPVGKRLMAQCADTLKRTSLELGGNAPFIIFADADLDLAVEAAIQSKFRNSGQTCVCANRLLVEAEVHDVFVDRLAARVRALRVGNGTDPTTDQGPLIDGGAVNRMEALVADAVGHGATVVTGGHRHAAGDNFFEPTILAGVGGAMRVAREELFGPIAPVIAFDSEAEAIALANDTPLGLASYVFTRDVARAWRIGEALEAGMVGINTGLLSTEVAPFGGVKESGMGREGGRQGIEDYLDVKYLCLGNMAAG